MGFNKRYISKDTVMYELSNGGDVSRLLKADALIMDDWSSKFFKEYKNDAKYRSDRQRLLDDTMFLSFHSATLEHQNFNKLKNLSNILENLYLDPSWVDILLTFDILGGDDVPKSAVGKYEKLRTICIDKIEKHFNGH
jgi:hypothetical protein